MPSVDTRAEERVLWKFSKATNMNPGGHTDFLWYVTLFIVVVVVVVVVFLVNLSMAHQSIFSLLYLFCSKMVIVLGPQTRSGNGQILRHWDKTHFPTRGCNLCPGYDCFCSTPLRLASTWHHRCKDPRGLIQTLRG